MKTVVAFAGVMTIAAALAASVAAPRAEVLALVNYKSKPAEALRAYASTVRGHTRQEGLAIIDVDPESANFGQIVRNIDLPPDLVAHHIFYNSDCNRLH